MTRLDGASENEIEWTDAHRVKETMNRTLRALLLSLAAVILLPSCYDTGMIYPAGGYASGYSGFDDYAPIGYNQPVYGGYGGFGGFGGYRGFGGGFNQFRGCNRCGYNPCRCSGGSNHHHSGGSSRSSSSSSNSSDRKYRIIAGDLDGKKKPNDFHSLDWYHSRGYSLENAKIETDRGAVIDKRPSSQKSSSSVSRSGSSSSNNRSKASSSHSNSGRSSSNSSSNSRSRSSSSSNSGNIREQIKAGLSKKK